MNLSLIRRASERQQARIRAENAANDPARTTFDDIDKAFDSASCSEDVARIAGSASNGIRTWTEGEWAIEQERRQVEAQINRDNLIGGV